MKTLSTTVNYIGKTITQSEPNSNSDVSKLGILSFNHTLWIAILHNAMRLLHIYSTTLMGTSVQLCESFVIICTNPMWQPPSSQI